MADQKDKKALDKITERHIDMLTDVMRRIEDETGDKSFSLSLTAFGGGDKIINVRPLLDKGPIDVVFIGQSHPVFAYFKVLEGRYASVKAVREKCSNLAAFFARKSDDESKRTFEMLSAVNVDPLHAEISVGSDTVAFVVCTMALAQGEDPKLSHPSS